MKLSNSYFYTLRENVKNEESISGNLLVRSGMIKKTSSGIYMYLPLGFKVLKNIEKIIREEMEKINCSELMMPSLIQSEVYESSGRREAFGKDMFSLKDRFSKDYVLGPTHEELFAIASKMKIRSYKDLPFSLYQFQTKYRDETRPRYGLIRIREFVMKDAYTFDKDYEGLDKSYNDMYNAYINIFNRLGIKYKIVKSDTGAMGGLLSEEFQAIADIGEDLLVICNHCDYTSNIDIAECVYQESNNNEKLKEKELIHTPNARTIEEVASFLNEGPAKFVKTLLYKGDNKLYRCLVRGDHEVNEIKLRKLLKVSAIEMVEPTEVETLINVKVGFLGPIGGDTPIIIDNEIKDMKNFVVGANKADYHYKNVNLSDFKYDLVGDIRNIAEGDLCPKCNKPIIFEKGIEIGNTFKLGTKYSEANDLYYLDTNNKYNPVIMGSHGIGLDRCVAAIVEQSYDDRGIIWPINVAPYKVSIVVVDVNDNKQMEVANHLYEELNNNNIDTLLDDRNERVGVKFNDMDLIGIPIRITIGKKINDNIIEVKPRVGTTININIEDIMLELNKYL
ncbi:MAG: proline--tRNA ligase [Bacilli bacterium]|nr:proline--tRNA ligase [Bacilli bacterium]